jgi:hypothetical protein
LIERCSERAPFEVKSPPHGKADLATVRNLWTDRSREKRYRMLIVRGDAQTLPSELNTAATGEVLFDPTFSKTDGVGVGTVVFSPNGRTVRHQHERGQLLQITSGYGFVCKEGGVP